MRKAISLLLIICICCTCSRLFFPDDIDDNPENNFNLLWQEFDRYYSHFEIKRVDWDSLYFVYRPPVTPEISEETLFRLMSSMLDQLRDGHVNLYTPHGNYVYANRWPQYPVNYFVDDIRRNYLGNIYEVTGNGRIVYGQLTPDLGYIHISTFEGEDDWILDIDAALDQFRNLRGIVVDVRHNSGGSNANSDYVASRFADRRRVHGYFKYRNGPNHDDFTELYERFIEPSKKWRFTKPTAVLTNRRSYSSTETFVLAMRAFPHVVVVGDTTGGGGGNPIYRELPNGWTYRLPVWVELTMDKEYFEGVGLVPDITVWISFADRTMGRDSILRTAMQLLLNE